MVETARPAALAREAWRAAVASAAEKARAKLPALVDSIDLAEQLTLAGAVILQQDGSATVGSQTTEGVTYTVHGQHCSCPRGTYAPAVLCKHTLAVMITRRALELTATRVAQATGTEHEATSRAPHTDPEPAPDPDPGARGIAPQWIVPIQGKPHVLYAGLLSLAHSRGLVRLEAILLSVTAELATAKATATFADGKVFVECGDATPPNVNARIKPHYPRMALTRAKARALRDALNLGDLVAAEELGEG